MYIIYEGQMLALASQTCQNMKFAFISFFTDKRWIRVAEFCENKMSMFTPFET